ncbi:MAG: PAS domain-containing protein [Deltaproteobacteria bacterium]|nr:PAS domain-containing protein [Deltaproteobacteria bacterium]
MTFPRDIPCEAILDSIADGVFTVDLDWNITSFNQSAERIIGIPREEAIGQKCWDVFRSSLCDGDCAMRASLRTGEAVGGKSIFIIRPDGRKVPISVSAAPLHCLDGKRIGGVETFRDLSDIQAMRRTLDGRYTFEDIVGKSRPLRKIFDILPRIAESGSTVLLTGESGTGKELFARAIHNLSPRADKPMVTVNCGALPAELLESELFGYKAGAFTDAKKDKPGRFARAEGGTMFLDEIGDMPGPLQVKLLRVLQERTYEPLGGVETVRSDVRIIAATNKDLRELMAKRVFREDLYYRLGVAEIRLPPLRERPEDIPLLIDHFIRHFNHLKGKDIQGLSEDSQALLMRSNYPGNIRELENIIEFAFILCPSGFIQIEHLPDHFLPKDPSPRVRPLTLEAVKCEAVRQALARNDGKRMKACRELGITKDTLRRMIERCSREDPGFPVV